MRAFYFAIVLLFCLGCQQQGIISIDAEKLTELQSDGILVVDIRTPEEYNQGHIPGVKLINFRDNDFLAQMNELDKSKPVIIHCARGGRSGNAANQLIKAGFTTIYDYSGGFNDWKAKGLEIE